MKKFALLGALSVTIAAPLAAQSADAPTGTNGWGDARWGQSVDDVLKPLGANGQKTDLMDKGKWLGSQREGATSTTSLNGHPYEVKYYFTPEGSKLSGVTLVGKKKAACDSLQAYFIGHLGKGTQKSEPMRLDVDVVMNLSVRDWADARGGNRFQMVYITDPKTPVVFCRMRMSEPTINWNRSRV